MSFRSLPKRSISNHHVFPLPSEAIVICRTPNNSPPAIRHTNVNSRIQRTLGCTSQVRFLLLGLLLRYHNLTNWSVENDLVMNIQKCKVLILQKPGIQHDLDFLPNLDIVDELKILGVIFNKTLTWKSHIGYSVKKCSRLLYAFRILRSILSSSSMKRLYISLVLPVIEYCAPIFVALSSTDSRRLTRLQSRFHRIICGSNCKNDCFDDLNERRLVLASDFLDKIRNPAHILHHYLPPLSKTGRFLLPSRRTEQRSRHVLLYACERANATIKR